MKSFDPSDFENDIYAATMVGLGRGKGFKVGQIYSVLDNKPLTRRIASRCRIILEIIEGRKTPANGETSALRAEVEMLKSENLRERRRCEDLVIKIVEQEEQSLYWKRETSSLRREREEYVAQLAGFEDDARNLNRTVAELGAEVKRLKTEQQHENQAEDEEDEMLATEEMQEILDRINTSANADFEYLTDAVDFLLEAG